MKLKYILIKEFYYLIKIDKKNPWMRNYFIIQLYSYQL